MKKLLIQCKNAYKAMVLVKKSYQEDPFAVILVVVAWPEVAYEIDFQKKSQISNHSRNSGPEIREIKNHKLLKSSLECSPGSRVARIDPSRQVSIDEARESS